RTPYSTLPVRIGRPAACWRPADMPVAPRWLPYFQVENADKSAERAGELGGKINNPPMDIPSIGRMAMLAAPQGAAFAIIKLA
ncbi:MAG: VOC family protein, partial [Terriglobia bacterium]